MHLKQIARGHFDPNVLNSTQESAVPAVVVDGKAGVEESHFVFSVARWFLVTTCRTHWMGVQCSSLLLGPHGDGGER